MELAVRSAAELNAALVALVRGGNGALTALRDTYGITAKWGDDGKVTVSGIMLVEVNAFTTESSTINPSITVTNTTNQPTVTVTDTENRPQITSTTEVTQLASITTDSTPERVDTRTVTEPQETQETYNGGIDTTVTDRIYKSTTGGSTIS